MDSSRRAVESYWRSRMVDAATSDEDKVTPVYKLEEICELLRSSHVNIVKEISEFILKRLEHKSPIVKQKALRLIKYAVGKSGVEFRREMQRHSAAVRQLFHYRGQTDPLKGDALNKAVRDTAHEAISAIFSEENKPATTENLNKRIQGFGNTNFEMPSEDRKSFLSEVRMKAVCVLESILRKRDDEQFSIVASYFSENKDLVVRCTESPQSSLREKSIKVLSLLGGEQAGGLMGNLEKSVKAETISFQMPDLIDTGDSNDFFETNDSTKEPIDQNTANLTTSTSHSIDDLFGDNYGDGGNSREQKTDDNPFADVSFHTSESREHVDDLFSGMTVDSKPGTNENHMTTNKNGPEPFDIFGSNSELTQEQGNRKMDVNDLMAGMSINENVSKMNQSGATSGLLPESIFTDSSNHSGHQLSNDALTSILGSQVTGMNANSIFPSGTMQQNIPPGFMLNPAFHTQHVNYGAMGNFLAHQQFLATMSNFQHLNNLNAQNLGVSHAVGTNGVGYSSVLPDIFQSNYPNQAPSSLMNNSKKEETRAFDFISGRA
ncbi:hypothetical protein GH714_035455 [Hevea brasiliensis]|uniref:VHS domain-containing protein n=1 Tax=Hevea brasiliensis TaxID=3981 RepID=A0A6A6NEE8_HEVBR|nr:hypothetical protein GH714_035455 [Hevea brasiliensis]